MKTIRQTPGRPCKALKQRQVSSTITGPFTCQENEEKHLCNLIPQLNEHIRNSWKLEFSNIYIIKIKFFRCAGFAMKK